MMIGLGKEETDEGILYGACADSKRGEDVLNGVHVEGKGGNKSLWTYAFGFIKERGGASCREGWVSKGNVNRIPYTIWGCDHIIPIHSDSLFVIPRLALGCERIDSPK